MTEKEQWKPIYGYEGKYEISSFGRVKSLPKTWKRKDGVPLHYKERILKPRINAYGYARVTLSKNGKPKDFFIHRLVAFAFINNPLNLAEVNHKDENPLNNKVDNLEWCSHLYNNNYGTKSRRGALSNGHKVHLFDLKGNYICTFPTMRDACRLMGCYLNQIRDCIDNKYKQGAGYIWRKENQLHIENEKLVDIEKGLPINTSLKKDVICSAYTYNKDPNYITKADAASYLKIARSTLQYYVRCIGYESFKYGKYRYFHKKDIEEIKTTLNGMSRVKSKARQKAISELINKHNNKQL